MQQCPLCDGIGACVHHGAGDVWHVLLEGLGKADVLYGFKVAGEGGWETGHRWFPDTILLDPYAPLVWGRQHFGKRDEREHFRPKARRHPH
jgi:isoamylase